MFIRVDPWFLYSILTPYYRQQRQRAFHGELGAFQLVPLRVDRDVERRAKVSLLQVRVHEDRTIKVAALEDGVLQVGILEVHALHGAADELRAVHLPLVENRVVHHALIEGRAEEHLFAQA